MSKPAPILHTKRQIQGVAVCTIGFVCSITLALTSPASEWWWYPLAVLNAVGVLLNWYEPLWMKKAS